MHESLHCEFESKQTIGLKKVFKFVLFKKLLKLTTIKIVYFGKYIINHRSSILHW